MLKKDAKLRYSIKQILKQNIMIDSSIKFIEKIRSSNLDDVEKAIY
jgi:hypothetical protein